ncbi:hypothetical protein F4679DRAFT_544902 [Xylaria curta]|nr:hypothetical protein F4679DRAFT_544902 [Xylaria curta]
MSTSNVVNQYPVYVGVWTNWSRGPILGSTLTLNRRDADLLIAFIAFFVAFVAGRVWKILYFILHRVFSSTQPQGAIYHQHQAILRNTWSPEESIRLLLKLLWANRYSRRISRPISTTLIAASCLATFIVAGGFSSKISTALGDEVLIKSLNCGYPPAQPVLVDIPAVDSYLAEKVSNAANYAQQCYANNTTGLLDCGRFTKTQLPGDKNERATCPFKNNICRDNFANIRIDSGFLDSHTHLGLNTPPNRRIRWRTILHCAPLATEGFTTIRNASFGVSTVYHYGNISVPDGQRDYIFAAKSLQSQYSYGLSPDSMLNYGNFDLQLLNYVVKDRSFFEDSDFYPIYSIARDDADVIIVFLSGNGILFKTPSEDLWYRVAPTAVDYGLFSINKSGSSKAYPSQEPASPLGCTQQYQFCSTAFKEGNGCGPLASLRDAIAGAAPFFDTHYDDVDANIAKTEIAAHFNYFFNAGFYTNALHVDRVLQRLGPTSLLSQKHLLAGFQFTLEANQWQQDVAHWWDIVMSSRQASFLDTAAGPADPGSLVSWVKYSTPDQIKLCSNQKMRSTAYASFSLFGLIFTTVVGLLLILTSYLLEPVSEWLYNNKEYKQYEHLEWTTNATLQLQRLVYEELNLGSWSNCTEVIPTVKADEVLGCLDITDPKHPVVRPVENQIIPSDEAQNITEAMDTTESSTQEESSPLETDDDSDSTELPDRSDGPLHNTNQTGDCHNNDSNKEILGDTPLSPSIFPLQGQVTIPEIENYQATERTAEGGPIDTQHNKIRSGRDFQALPPGC